jgi:hypothetical protein
LCGNHPGILAEKKENLAFATTAIFWRFPNEKPEKPIFYKKVLTADFADGRRFFGSR